MKNNEKDEPTTIEHDKHEGKPMPFLQDGYDVFAAIVLGIGLIWFIKSGNYEAFRLWVHSIMFGS